MLKKNKEKRRKNAKNFFNFVEVPIEVFDFIIELLEGILD